MNHSFLDLGDLHVVQGVLNSVQRRSIACRRRERFDHRRVVVVVVRRSIRDERSFLFQTLLKFFDSMIELTELGLFRREHFALIGDLSTLLFVQFISNLKETRFPSERKMGDRLTISSCFNFSNSFLFADCSFVVFNLIFLS